MMSGWSAKEYTIDLCCPSKQTGFSFINFWRRLSKSRALSGYASPLSGCQRGRDSEEYKSLLGLGSSTPDSLSMFLVKTM